MRCASCGSAPGPRSATRSRARSTSRSAAREEAGGPGSRRASGRPPRVLLLSDGAQTSGDVRPSRRRSARGGSACPSRRSRSGPATLSCEVPLPGGLQQRVVVTPEPQTLRLHRRTTGGRFSQAPDAAPLDEVYRELGTRLAQRPQARRGDVRLRRGRRGAAPPRRRASRRSGSGGRCEHAEKPHPGCARRASSPPCSGRAKPAPRTSVAASRSASPSRDRGSRSPHRPAAACRASPGRCAVRSAATSSPGSTRGSATARSTSASAARTAPRLARRDDRSRGALHCRLHRVARAGRRPSGRSSAASRPPAVAAGGRHPSGGRPRSRPGSRSTGASSSGGSSPATPFASQRGARRARGCSGRSTRTRSGSRTSRAGRCWAPCRSVARSPEGG